MRKILTVGGVLILLTILLSCSFALALDQPYAIPSGMMSALKSRDIFSPNAIPFSSIRAIPAVVKSATDYVVKQVIVPNVKYNARASVVEILGFNIPNFVFLIIILGTLAAGGGTLYARVIKSPSIKDDLLAILIFFILVIVVREVLEISGLGAWSGLVSTVLIISFVLIALLSGRGSILNDFKPFAISVLGAILVLLAVFPSETANFMYELLIRLRDLGKVIFVDHNLFMVPLTIFILLWVSVKAIQKHGWQ